MEFASFPKNLSYNIKTLSGFSKTTTKLTPDKTGVIKNGDTIKVKLPSNTIVDLRTFSMMMEGTCESTGQKAHFPRLTSSLIKTLAVYVNGTLIERIDHYNVLYNKLYDLEAGNDQTSKRFLEIADPSISYKVSATGSTAGQPVNNTLIATPSTAGREMAVNNWLGFLSSASCPCIDTNDLNNVEVEITFADKNVLWSSGAGTAGDPIVGTDFSYKLENLHFTISKIVFNDPLYYNMKASKLLSSGLTIGYQTYIASKGARVAKGTSMNILTTINSTSLDQLICCLQATDAIDKLQLDGTNAATNGKTFEQVLASGAYTGGAASPAVAAGDLYNQSIFFKSDATGLSSSQIEINNTPLMPQPLSPPEIYNETLIALGNNNLDMSSGVHPGCRSIAHFLKYYFTHIVSLENIQNDGFYKSGLDGKASALNVAWKMVVNLNTTDTTPFIFAKTTRMMVVNEGHSISVVV